MYQQREKLQQISMIILVVTILLALFGVFKSFLLFLYLACFLVSIHIITEGLLLQFSHLKQTSIRLLIIGMTLLIITSYLFFRFLKGS